MFQSSALDLDDVGAKECPKWIAAKLGLPVEDIASHEITSVSCIYNTLLVYLKLIAVDATQAPPKSIDPNADKPESPGRLSNLWTDMDSDISTIRDRSASSSWRLGLGHFRLQVDGADVFIVHIARGDPIPLLTGPILFRQLLLFSASPETLEKVLASAVEWKDKEDEKNRVPKKNKYILFTLQVIGGHARWKNHGQKDARPLSSVFLKEGLQKSILTDMQGFCRPPTKKWYINHGLPYHRAYLFYGPPGVGKTSLIRGLAGELKLTACFLSIVDIGDKQLQSALDRVPDRSIVVLEDVDVLFNKERKSQTTSAVTFSGMLNVLDGLVSAEGVLIVMTTNHIDRLDPALIRAGRVDRRFEFGLPELDQIESLFKSFYPDAENGLAKKFANSVFQRSEKDARSIATLQQHFVYTRGKSAQESFDLLPVFFKEFHLNIGDESTGNFYT